MSLLMTFLEEAVAPTALPKGGARVTSEVSRLLPGNQFVQKLGNPNLSVIFGKLISHISSFQRSFAIMKEPWTVYWTVPAFCSVQTVPVPVDYVLAHHV
ncbi:hypothetical protein Pint_13766 [Pistacia integerrima]|uniref:Uncharacterized protein n=1 Tax=Pistacia integerrima TaxID=434235 RepID=A0ACC0Y7C6_9ROSI|nr:hypothetical protein Pint_13766 [Pistacia integerrima]